MDRRWRFSPEPGDHAGAMIQYGIERLIETYGFDPVEEAWQRVLKGRRLCSKFENRVHEMTMISVDCEFAGESLSTAELARRVLPPGSSAALFKKTVREFNRYYDQKTEHWRLMEEARAATMRAQQRAVQLPPTAVDEPFTLFDIDDSHFSIENE
jgi:hypothetical protein